MEDRNDDYLAMAEEAEKAATKAQTLVAKQCWHAIAREYRELKRMQDDRKSGNSS